MCLRWRRSSTRALCKWTRRTKLRRSTGLAICVCVAKSQCILTCFRSIKDSAFNFRALRLLERTKLSVIFEASASSTSVNSARACPAFTMVGSLESAVSDADAVHEAVHHQTGGIDSSCFFIAINFCRTRSSIQSPMPRLCNRQLLPNSPHRPQDKNQQLFVRASQFCHRSHSADDGRRGVQCGC